MSALAVKQEQNEMSLRMNRNLDYYTKDGYNRAVFKTVDNKVIPKPPLKTDTNSVLVKAQSNLLTVRDRLVIQEFRTLASVADIAPDIKSIIVYESGELSQPFYTDAVAFKTSYVPLRMGTDSGNQYVTQRLRSGEKPPYPYVGVTVDTPFRLGLGVTDKTGRYSLYTMLPPCPGFQYILDFNITANIPYSVANPVSGRSTHYLPVGVPAYAYCSGLSEIPISSNTLTGQVTGLGLSALEASLDSAAKDVNRRKDIPVSVFVLAGESTISNDVQIEGQAIPNAPRITVNSPKTTYDYTAGSSLFWAQGLLQSITKKDFKDTDVYIFRSGTGELINEGERGINIQVSNNNGWKIKYNVVIPGFDQSGALKLKNNLSGVKPGEKLDVVVINRATGYVGMETIALKPLPGSVEVRVPAIKMGPPNLRIHVSRKFDSFIRLDTNQSIDQSTVGFEGSGLTSDKQLMVWTDWRDRTGRLFPDKLPGYTGRITKAVRKSATVSELANSSPSTAEFQIKPSKIMQVLNFPKDFKSTAKEHFYVHVNGQYKQQSYGTPDFSPDPSAVGIWQYRPSHPVPMMVQVADIYASDTLKNQLIADHNAEAYKPVYQWSYRPEAQYTLIKFEPTKIEPTIPTGIQMIDLTKDPSLAQQLIDGYSVLLGPEIGSSTPPTHLNPIDRFGSTVRGFELVVYDAYSNPVSTINIDQNGVASISNPVALTAQDYVTLSLFQSDDPENILWSFAPIELISSGDLESRYARSFLVYDPTNKYGISSTKQSDGSAMINDPIKAKINGYTNVDPGTKIQWHVQAVNSVPPLTYGGIYEVFTGNTNAGVAKPATGVNRCAVGTDSSLWTSDSLDLSTARELRFRPCPPSHNPTAYTQGTGGTKSIDVHRKNPRLAYEISATITVPNSSSVTLAKVIAEMDEKDMIRQEYITHIQSAPTSVADVKVPLRAEVVLESSLGEGYWGSYTDPTQHTGYPYQYVVNNGMVKLWEDFKLAFSASAGGDIPLIDYYAQWRPAQGSGLTDPYAAYPTTKKLAANQTALVTSAYRNPERNEKIGGVPASRHMLGRALDITVNSIGGYGSQSRGVAFYKVWQVIHGANATAAKSSSATVPWADRWALETGGSKNILVSSDGKWVDPRFAEDLPLGKGNGIPDGYELTGHLHIQDNPNEGAHK